MGCKKGQKKPRHDTSDSPALQSATNSNRIERITLISNPKNKDIETKQKFKHKKRSKKQKGNEIEQMVDLLIKRKEDKELMNRKQSDKDVLPNNLSKKRKNRCLDRPDEVNKSSEPKQKKLKLDEKKRKLEKQPFHTESLSQGGLLGESAGDDNTHLQKKMKNSKRNWISDEQGWPIKQSKKVKGRATHDVKIAPSSDMVEPKHQKKKKKKRKSKLESEEKVLTKKQSKKAGQKVEELLTVSGAEQKGKKSKKNKNNLVPEEWTLPNENQKKLKIPVGGDNVHEGTSTRTTSKWKKKKSKHKDKTKKQTWLKELSEKEKNEGLGEISKKTGSKKAKKEKKVNCENPDDKAKTEKERMPQCELSVDKTRKEKKIYSEKSVGKVKKRKKNNCKKSLDEGRKGKEMNFEKPLDDGHLDNFPKPQQIEKADGIIGTDPEKSKMVRKRKRQKKKSKNLETKPELKRKCNREKNADKSKELPKKPSFERYFSASNKKILDQIEAESRQNVQHTTRDGHFIPFASTSPSVETMGRDEAHLMSQENHVNALESHNSQVVDESNLLDPTQKSNETGIDVNFTEEVKKMLEFLNKTQLMASSKYNGQAGGESSAVGQVNDEANAVFELLNIQDTAGSETVVSGHLSDPLPLIVNESGVPEPGENSKITGTKNISSIADEDVIKYQEKKKVKDESDLQMINKYIVDAKNKNLSVITIPIELLMAIQEMKRKQLSVTVDERTQMREEYLRLKAQNDKIMPTIKVNNVCDEEFKSLERRHRHLINRSRIKERNNIKEQLLQEIEEKRKF